MRKFLLLLFLGPLTVCCGAVDKEQSRSSFELPIQETHKDDTNDKQRKNDGVSPFDKHSSSAEVFNQVDSHPERSSRQSWASYLPFINPIDSQTKVHSGLFSHVADNIKANLDLVKQRQDVLLKFAETACPNSAACQRVPDMDDGNFDEYKLYSWLFDKTSPAVGVDKLFAVMNAFKNSVEKLTLRQNVLYEHVSCSCTTVNECHANVKPILEVMFSNNAYISGELVNSLISGSKGSTASLFLHYLANLINKIPSISGWIGSHLNFFNPLSSILGSNIIGGALNHFVKPSGSSPSGGVGGGGGGFWSNIFGGHKPSTSSEITNNGQPGSVAVGGGGGGYGGVGSGSVGGTSGFGGSSGFGGIGGIGGSAGVGGGGFVGLGGVPGYGGLGGIGVNPGIIGGSFGGPGGLLGSSVYGNYGSVGGTNGIGGGGGMFGGGGAFGGSSGSAGFGGTGLSAGVGAGVGGMFGRPGGFGGSPGFGGFGGVGANAGVGGGSGGSFGGLGGSGGSSGVIGGGFGGIGGFGGGLGGTGGNQAPESTVGLGGETAGSQIITSGGIVGGGTGGFGGESGVGSSWSTGGVLVPKPGSSTAGGIVLSKPGGQPIPMQGYSSATSESSESVHGEHVSSGGNVYTSLGGDLNKPTSGHHTINNPGGGTTHVSYSTDGSSVSVSSSSDNNGGRTKRQAVLSHEIRP